MVYLTFLFISRIAMDMKTIYLHYIKMKIKFVLQIRKKDDRVAAEVSGRIKNQINFEEFA